MTFSASRKITEVPTEYKVLGLGIISCWLNSWAKIGLGHPLSIRVVICTYLWYNSNDTECPE